MSERTFATTLRLAMEMTEARPMLMGAANFRPQKKTKARAKGKVNGTAS